jgi:hypothetical protein
LYRENIMKKISVTGLLLLLCLAACAPFMYGVPQESWDRMSQPERLEAMRAYERNEQARRQAAEERARARDLEAQAHRQAAEERARHEAWEREQAREREDARARQAALERERHERFAPPPVVIKEREHRAPVALTAPFISGRTLRWETDALGGQNGTIYVTSTNGTSFYLDQKNHKNAAAGITKLEGKIKDGKIFINNSKWGETWVGTLSNGTVTGKINNRYSFRISE